MARPTMNVTAEYMRMRCRECADCLEWISTARSHHARKHPLIKFEGKVQLVRRVMYTLSGRTIQPGRVVLADCGNEYCVNPEHQVQLYESQKCQRAAAAGAFSRPGRRAAIAAARRASGKLKLTIKAAREIRNSSETELVLAARYGISRTTVGHIKRGRLWKEYGAANPFAGLMAANDARRAAA